MIIEAKKDIFSELNKASLQIESIEAQLENTFDLKKKSELKEELKTKWGLIDRLLDMYNQRKRPVKISQ